MSDELDRALRDQARTFTDGNEVGAPDLDAVVRHSAARQRARIAAVSLAAVVVVAIGVFGVVARPDTADVATVPDAAPSTDPAPTTSGVGATGSTTPSETLPSPVITESVPAPPPTSMTTVSTPPTTRATAATSPPTTAPAADPTCSWNEPGLVITYPQGWYADSSCSRFDPGPQGPPIGSDAFDVAIWLNVLEEDLDTAIAQSRASLTVTIESEELLRFGANDAYCYEGVATGLGLAPQGSLLDSCMVSFPTGVVLFTTLQQPPDIDPTPSRPAEMRWMAERASHVG
jgi:hypothetical protein